MRVKTYDQLLTIVESHCWPGLHSHCWFCLLHPGELRWCRYNDDSICEPYYACHISLCKTTSNNHSACGQRYRNSDTNPGGHGYWLRHLLLGRSWRPVRIECHRKWHHSRGILCMEPCRWQRMRVALGTILCLRWSYWGNSCTKNHFPQQWCRYPNSNPTWHDHNMQEISPGGLRRPLRVNCHRGRVHFGQFLRVESECGRYLC